MGKTIKLTEEQIHRLFGEGFGKKLIGERNQKPITMDDVDKYQMADASKRYSDIGQAGHSYANGTNEPGEDDYYHTGFHYVPREGKDLPGWGGAVAKMAGFGQANLANQETPDNNELLKIIKSLHGQNTEQANPRLNLLDVLDILHRLKSGKGSSKKIRYGKLGDEKEITEEDAFNFLNSINIDFILSNFVTVNAPDYVFWRLKNLTPEEIANIRKTYGRDFRNFGQRCDGCGLSTWKTTVALNAHDDAHINMEYMGSDASKTKEYTLSEGKRAYVEKPIPFQIHHMNENPGDNSPLNLSCLCPNCHALTGSYGKKKTELDSESFNILASLEDTGTTGSLTDVMSDEEKTKIVNSLKKGEFDKRSIVNNIMGVNLTDNLNPSDPELQKHISMFGVKNPKKFITDFNKLFNSIWNEGKEKYITFNKISSTIDSKKLEESYVLEDNDDNDDDIEETGNTSTGKHILDGIETTCNVGISNRGNVFLELYIGTPPFIFDAFKNNAISLTPMYFEDEKRRNIATNDIRNRILGAVLNCVKEYHTKMSDWESPYSKSEYRDLKPTSMADREKIKIAFAEKGGSERNELAHSRKKRAQPRQKLVYSEGDISGFLSAYKDGNQKIMDGKINGIQPGVSTKFPNGLPGMPRLKTLQELLDNGCTVKDALIKSGISPDEETAEAFIKKFRL